MWSALKARLLAAGKVSVTGEPFDEYIARSRAGPGAGGSGSIFFTMNDHRVRLSLADKAQVEIFHEGEGKAVLKIDGEKYYGFLEKPGLHCPHQAYITITGSCIFHCRYCNVPNKAGSRKSINEIENMVESVIQRIDAISLTSGVLTDINEEEEYVLAVVNRLLRFNLPIGVSIYPADNTPQKLKSAGVSEVKFNLETATSSLFKEMCPGLDRVKVISALRTSVSLFGRDHVFSNIILGLGESDDEMMHCIKSLCSNGIIPVIRPLTPSGELSGSSSPDSYRIIRIFNFLKFSLEKSGLNPKNALTMCPACTGCDLIPERDE